MLDSLDLTLALPKSAAKTVLRDMLDRVAVLSEMVFEEKRAVLVVFEGWDAAGKGTTIRGLTERLDARGYKVLSTQAPRTHEKQKPWLWRFWMNIPRYGQIAIFDRSWYGRVLVERVLGLTPMPEWIAAYEEINQFERTLADDGAIIIKSWLHISRQEQLRRYIELSRQPENSWRVTAEDWENHRRYDDYLAAVRDMLANTSTKIAPWTVVPATNREYRMYVVCRTLIETLERGLGLEPTTWPEPAALDAYDSERAAQKAAAKAAKQERKAAKAAKLNHDETVGEAIDEVRAGAEPEAEPDAGSNGKKDKKHKKAKDEHTDKIKDRPKEKAKHKAKEKAKEPAFAPAVTLEATNGHAQEAGFDAASIDSAERE